MKCKIVPPPFIMKYTLKDRLCILGCFNLQIGYIDYAILIFGIYSLSLTLDMAFLTSLLFCGRYVWTAQFSRPIVFYSISVKNLLPHCGAYLWFQMTKAVLL